MEQWAKVGQKFRLTDSYRDFVNDNLMSQYRRGCEPDNVEIGSDYVCEIEGIGSFYFYFHINGILFALPKDLSRNAECIVN